MLTDTYSLVHSIRCEISSDESDTDDVHIRIKGRTKIFVEDNISEFQEERLMF